MKLSNNMVPIIPKSEFDDVAIKFLQKYYPRCIETPMAIPIEKIAVQIMGLQIKRMHLSEDLSILGQVFFSSGFAEIYKKGEDEYIFEQVEKGTMFIDPDVAVERNVGSERNTIAHECVHWNIHRTYHSVQIMAGGEKAVAFRCPTNPPSEQLNSKWTDEDWMEWQANGIAPKILMPKTTFISYVDSHSLSSKMKNENSELIVLYRDLLIGDLADFFQVSKQSASIRLSELGFI
jgi:hypothetical protein